MKQFIKIAAVLILVFITMQITGSFKSYISNFALTSYYSYKVVIFLAVIILLIGLLIDIKKSKWKESFKNLLLSTIVLGSLFWIIEFAFTFVPISNQNMVPLSSLTWEAFYHRKLNNLGFRDIDISKKNIDDRKKLFFLGDSYTDGFGIKNKRNRFSNILEEKLKDEFVSFHFGKSGISTREEFEILKQFEKELKPDAIIWQYFFNDVNDVCFDQLQHYPELDVYKNISSSPRWFIKRSYFINFLVHKFYPNKGYTEFMNFFDECARSEKVQQAYYKELQTLKAYCDERDIDLFFLIIPNPMHPNLTVMQDNNMEQYLKQLGINYLNVTEKLKEIPVKERIISNQDMHLSKKSHQIVAHEIYQIYLENKMF